MNLAAEHILRGGDFQSATSYSRCASRASLEPGLRLITAGFRPVLSTAAVKLATAGRPKKHYLRIRAVIDGVDEFRVFKSHIEWNHRSFSPPASVYFNNVHWPDISRHLHNEGPTTYLKIESITPKATMKVIKGRGRVEFLTTAPGPWYVSIDDSQVGGDAYVLEISWEE